MAYKPVDTAIKIIVGPLIDDTDFKSREESVAYNAAGLEIDVIVEKADGTIATTAVTPTTGGDYDWAHTDQGYYELELPASGGASFNNTEEGIVRVVGYATGVLPFASIAYDVVPTTVYNSMVRGTDTLPVDVTQLGGVAQSATDLKDLADTGYNPATHKMAGVVLADTVTTLTGHTAQTGDSFTRLGAPDGASVSADILAAKGDTAAILLDTGTDGVVVASASKTGYALAAAYDAAKTAAQAGDAMNLEADAIKAVSYDESTAWPVTASDAGATQIARVGADGDTLETLSDEIGAVATTIGAAGAGLTALGDARLDNLDAAISTRTKPADTQAAVTTVTNLTNAPTAGDLTAAMVTSVTAAVPTTAAIKTAMEVDGSKLDHLWEMTEDDVGVRRLTENALEEAPAGGGGGDATAANQVLILEDLEDVKGTGHVTDTNSLTNVTGAAAVNVSVGTQVTRKVGE